MIGDAMEQHHGKAGQPFVSAGDLKGLTQQVSLSVTNRSEGIFGPRSISWRINRESALFLAAGRAALLQLAHPQVAAALAEHSRTLQDPIGRFHQTFRVVFTMVFGTLDDAVAASQHLHRRHTTIRGTMPQTVGAFAAGSRYEANDLAALCWVYATLVESALMAYELVLPPLTSEEREGYYSESKRMAALFGIGECSLPKSWPEFVAYCRATVESDTLAVSEAARQMADSLLAGAGSWVRPPLWYRALTAHLLPARLREEFALAYDGPERARAERAMSLFPRLYPRLPSALRFVGPYRQACARLAGKPEGAVAIRLSNRFWMGQPTLGVHAAKEYAQ